MGAASQSSAPDGAQLINDSDLSSDDELYGLLDKSAAHEKVRNGNYVAHDGTVHGVQQYVGNMSSMLSGINIDHSTVVH